MAFIFRFLRFDSTLSWTELLASGRERLPRKITFSGPDLPDRRVSKFHPISILLHRSSNHSRRQFDKVAFVFVKFIWCSNCLHGVRVWSNIQNNYPFSEASISCYSIKIARLYSRFTLNSISTCSKWNLSEHYFDTYKSRARNSWNTYNRVQWT